MQLTVYAILTYAEIFFVCIFQYNLIVILKLPFLNVNLKRLINIKIYLLIFVFVSFKMFDKHSIM